MDMDRTELNNLGINGDSGAGEKALTLEHIDQS